MRALLVLDVVLLMGFAFGAGYVLGFTRCAATWRRALGEEEA